MKNLQNTYFKIFCKFMVSILKMKNKKFLFLLVKMPFMLKIIQIEG